MSDGKKLRTKSDTPVFSPILFGASLRRWRRACGFSSVDKLGDAIKKQTGVYIDHETLLRTERGIAEPSISKLLAMCQALAAANPDYSSICEDPYTLDTVSDMADGPYKVLQCLLAESRPAALYVSTDEPFLSCLEGSEAEARIGKGDGGDCAIEFVRTADGAILGSMTYKELREAVKAMTNVNRHSFARRMQSASESGVLAKFRRDNGDLLNRISVINPAWAESITTF